MGKKNTNAAGSALGRALVKDRFGKRNRPRHGKDSMLHTTELDDGQEWNRIDFTSITEQTHLDEFLETAELAGTEFQAVKLNVNFVKPTTTVVGLPSEREQEKMKEAQDANRSMLRIPRRPPWNILTTAEMLAESERNKFLEWRRCLAQLEETENILLTPFERNLHFWRQLWRVIEKSDVVVQIVDARNPLLFRCEDLEAYVKEVSPLKDNLILVNKSDFLNESQREAWTAYFRKNNISAVFFSALEGEELDIIREDEEIAFKENDIEMKYEINESDNESENENNNAVFFSALGGEEVDIIREDEEIPFKENNDIETKYEINENDSESENEHNNENEKEYKVENETDKNSEPAVERRIENNIENTVNSQYNGNKNGTFYESEENDIDQHVEECRYDIQNFSSIKFDGGLENYTKGEINTEHTSNENRESNNEATYEKNPLNSKYVTTSKLFSRVDLINLFKVIHKDKRVSEKYVTIGLVGYPNVGKSSTINCLMNEKKVSVSATPGKTKHFQTLFLNDDILLCDCPGLVFPAFVATKADMIISGILPIDQMRDHVPSINLVASMFPRDFLENTYSIHLPKPLEGEDPNRPPTSEEFLNTYGFLRGFMTQRGQPDNPRTARYVLKDYMNGKLLYCHTPLNCTQEEYHEFKYVKAQKVRDVQPTPQQLATRPYQQSSESVDKRFFSAQASGIQYKGQRKIFVASGSNAGTSGESTSEGTAPYKPWRNNSKRNSKQKARKQFAHLDQ